MSCLNSSETGAGEKPQLPTTSVVTPWRILDSARGLAQSRQSECECMSMKPGMTASPAAESVRPAGSRERSPIAAMASPAMPRSPPRAGAPVPSMSWPPAILMSSISLRPAGFIAPPRSNGPPSAVAAARSACPVIVGLLPARCNVRPASSDSPALDTRQSCALHPQPSGGGVVPGFVRGRGRAPLVEIAAADVGHLGRGGEMDDRVRSLLGGDGEQLGDPDDVGEHAAALVTEAGGDEPGMQAVGGDPGAGQTMCELARVQDVAQLRAAVNLEAPVAGRRLQVAEVKGGAPVSTRRGVDHARRRRGGQP